MTKAWHADELAALQALLQEQGTQALTGTAWRGSCRALRVFQCGQAAQSRGKLSSFSPIRKRQAPRAYMASVDATSHIQRINTPLTRQTLAHMHDRRQASAYGEQRGV